MILEALGKLDSTNDNHWTADGLPRLETVKMLSGASSLSREDVESVAPGWRRGDELPEAQEVSLQKELEAAAEELEAEVDELELPDGIIEEVETDETDEEEIVRQQLQTAREYIAGVRQGQKRLEEALKKGQELEALLIRRLAALQGPDDDATAIQQYLEAQKRQMEKNATTAKLVSQFIRKLK